MKDEGSCRSLNFDEPPHRLTLAIDRIVVDLEDGACLHRENGLFSVGIVRNAANFERLNGLDMFSALEDDGTRSELSAGDGSQSR